MRWRRAFATAGVIVAIMAVRYYTGVQGPITTAAESRVRVTVLWFAFLLAFVTYLDRVCISAAARDISNELHLTTTQLGVALSAFALAYALFEIPSGWLADVIGPRKVLTRIVLWWSAFTMLTGAATGYVSLVVIRFLFGAGEAGALPGASNCIARWFPRSERGKANGVLLFGTRVGGMVSVPLVLQIIRIWGWRASFVIVGSVGLVWAAAWYAWYRDSPTSHPSVSASELAWIEQDTVARDGLEGHRGRGGQGGAGEAGRETHAWRHAVAGPCHERESLGHLRDVLHVRLRSLLLLHVAADLSDQRPRLFRAARRAARRPAVSLRRRCEPGRRMADRLACPDPRPEDRPLPSGIRLVLHRRRADVCVDARARASDEGDSARRRARIRRPGAQRMLGSMSRRRRHARRRRHRLHEHLFESRRRADAAGGRVRGRPVAVVDVPVLRDGGRLRRRRSHVAGH